MTARPTSQQSSQTQLVAQGFSFLTQHLILQLQLSTFALRLTTLFFSQHIAPSVTSSAIFLCNCEKRSLVLSVFIDRTLLFDDSVP